MSSSTNQADNLSFYKGIPLKSCINYFKNLSEKEFKSEAAALEIKSMLQMLLKAKRFFDIATIYVFLKNKNENKGKLSEIFSCFNGVLERSINELFISSITYKSVELNEMFADIFGANHGLFMELVSLIFEKYDLFNAKLSDNIYKKFISVADEDIFLFVRHVNVRFLAFYLSALPSLPFVSKEHIEKWVNLILFNADSEELTLKIIKAMREHPSLEILLMFILSSKENERFKAMKILSDSIYLGTIDMKLFAKRVVYFVEKALSSTFYYFHAIPRSHKELLASFLMISDGSLLKPTLISLLHEKNPYNDPKITETKLQFIPVIQKFMNKFKEINSMLRLVLKDENVEMEVKEVVRKNLLFHREES